MACLNGTLNLRSVFGKDATLDHLTSSKMRTNATSFLLNDSYGSANSGYLSVYNSANSGSILGNFTSNTVLITSGLTLIAGNLVLIKDSIYNDGLYEVQSYSSGTLTIKTSPVEFFTSNSFNVTSSFSGTIANVFVNAIKSESNIWKTGYGNSAPLTYKTFGGGYNRVVVNTASYNIVGDEDILAINYDGNCTINLPLSSTFRTIIVDEGGNAGKYDITIQPQTGQKIVGNTSYKLRTPYSSVNLYGNGTDWFIG